MNNQLFISYAEQCSSDGLFLSFIEERATQKVARK